MASRVELVSWDLDGTLYDLATLRRHVTRSALSRAWAPSTWREMRALAQFRSSVEALRRKGAAVDDAWLRARAAALPLEARWYGPALGRTGPRPGLRALLESIAHRGARQVVVSDFAAEEKLAHLGLEGVFSHVFAGERIGHLKPSRRLFDEVAKRVGVHPAHAVHIGDRDDTDGAGARAAGWRFVLLADRLPTVEAILG